MEDNKKTNKITLSTYIAILAVLIIVVMAGFIYMQKINSDREIAGLKTDAEELKATVSELQGKLDSISNIAETSNEEEKTTNTSVADEMTSTSFTDEQVKESLANYFELKMTMGDQILKKLTQKGLLNYNESENKEIVRGGNLENKVTMKVKFSDYKKAMLNYVSESEFNKTFQDDFIVESNGDLSYETGIGGPDVYSTVKSITKKDDLSYTAKMEFVTQESLDPAEKETYNFTIKNYNGCCVIDSITE